MFPNMEDAEINSRLVGYCSDQVICMKMIIDLMIILAIDHLLCYCSDQVIYEDDH